MITIKEEQEMGSGDYIYQFRVPRSSIINAPLTYEQQRILMSSDEKLQKTRLLYLLLLIWEAEQRQQNSKEGDITTT